MSTSPTHRDIKLFILEQLKAQDMSPDEIDDVSPLAENKRLGMDSVDFLEIAVALEHRYGVRVNDSNLGREVMKSVDSIVAFVRRSAPQGQP